MLNSATIKSIQDVMRKDAGVDGDAQRLGQLTWLLFLKIFDDREQEWELTVNRYRSPIPEELRWRNWATDTEGLTGDGLLEFINNTLFPTLKALSAIRWENQESWKVRSSRIGRVVGTGGVQG